MSESSSLSASHLFNLTDCSFAEVQQELKTTAYFDIEFIEDTEPKLAFAKFSDFRMMPSSNEKIVQSYFYIYLPQVEHEDVNHSTGNHSTGNHKAAITWSDLKSLVNCFERESVQVLAARLIKPTSDLAGAIEFVTESLNLNESKIETTKRLVECLGLQISFTEALSPTLKEPGLLVMDMDSTAIKIECIDEIAKLVGVGEQVSAVTAAAMRGELDFSESLHARVSTLKGASAEVLSQVANNLPYMPGLRSLVSELKKYNWKVAIVSGGFTAMTEALKEQLGLDRTIANQLEIKDGLLTGKVLGEVVDAQAKADAVIKLAVEFDIPMLQTIAMGDGANDLKMIKVAALGVAFHAKPLVQKEADISFVEGSLDQLLYLMK